jgi:hypothetical protein
MAFEKHPQPNGGGERTRKNSLSLILYICASAFGALFLFLIAYYLQGQFPQAAAWWEALKTLAIAIFPAIVVALVDHFHTIGEVSDRMAMLVAKEVTDNLVPGRELYGFVRFINEMPFTALFEALQAGDELLWLDTYGPNYREFLGEIEPAIIRGVHIRMLVIDPDCDNAHFRAEEIYPIHGYPPPIFCQEVKSFVSIMIETAQRASSNSATRGSFQICSYQDLPCMPMYIILRNGRLLKGYTSMFLTKPTGINFVHLEWKPRDGGLLEEMKNYYDQKWKTITQGTPQGGKLHGKVLFSDSTNNVEAIPPRKQGTTDETSQIQTN